MVPTRRGVLATTAAVGASALAGCLDDGDDSEDRSGLSPVERWTPSTDVVARIETDPATVRYRSFDPVLEHPEVLPEATRRELVNYLDAAAGYGVEPAAVDAQLQYYSLASGTTTSVLVTVGSFDPDSVLRTVSEGRERVPTDGEYSYYDDEKGKTVLYVDENVVVQGIPFEVGVETRGRQLIDIAETGRGRVARRAETDEAFGEAAAVARGADSGVVVRLAEPAPETDPSANRVAGMVALGGGIDYGRKLTVSELRYVFESRAAVDRDAVVSVVEETDRVNDDAGFSGDSVQVEGRTAVARGVSLTGTLGDE